MELRHLRYFVAVAEELHFGRAAVRLGISQPPLSAQIRDLEEEVGARLFVRDRRGVAVTDAGKVMYARATELLAGARRMAREAVDVANGESGSLTVGYTTTAVFEVLPRALPGFRSRHPGLTLRLEEMASHTQGEALREGRIDVGLVCAPAVGLEDARFEVVAHDTVVLAAPRRHPLAGQPRLKLKDLEGIAMVGVRPTAEPGWAQACQAALAGAGVVADIVQEADTKLAMLGLVAAGLGVAIASSSLATLRWPGVVFLPIADARTRLTLGAVTRPERSPAVERFVGALRG